MPKEKKRVHPYIPNSVPEIKAKLMKEIGITDIEELYRVIPGELRLKRRLNLPEPFLAEFELKKHVSDILSKNKTCEESLNFLGAGCYQHFIPAICDEINGRSEFLTAYGGVPYTTLGRFQSCFEFQSQMGELLNMDVVGMPTYSWGTAAGYAVRMASRLTGRNEVLIAKTVDPERLDVIRTFCSSSDPGRRIDLQLADYDTITGLLDVQHLKNALTSRTAAIYFENPTCLGTIETQGREVSEIAHRQGAVCIVGVDPISLGVLVPPADYGADIVVGSAQTLGVHMNCGGGTSGFIATRDEERYIAENPLFLICITNTIKKGEVAFGQCVYERTSYMSREKAKDWVGTVSGLWTITASVYMALMGPQGFRDLGRTIIQKTHYAMTRISELRGIRVPFGAQAFREFVVNFDETGRSVKEVNNALLDHDIFGGKDLSKDFPELGNSALYCVTEIHTKNDIDRLVSTLQGVLTR